MGEKIGIKRCPSPSVSVSGTIMSQYFKIEQFTMATVRQLLFIWVAIYSQIRLCMQNILILIITYYRITTVIIKITEQNILIWE